MFPHRKAVLAASRLTATLVPLFFAASVLVGANATGGRAGTSPARPKGLIAFIDYPTTYNSEIYVMKADGSRRRRLTRYRGEDLDPAWSPDRKRIAFTRYVRGDSEIYVMNADGTGAKSLSRNGGRFDTQPAWSPDGKKIVFVSGAYVHGESEIYVMNSDGSDRTRITSLASRYPAPPPLNPVWSPDGTKIAFSAACDDGFEIDVCVMNADGGQLRSLTTHSEGDRHPAWSPDGRRIAFTSDRDGNYDVYVMNVNGSAQRS